MGFTLTVAPPEDERLSRIYLQRLHSCICDAIYNEFGPGTEILIKLEKVGPAPDELGGIPPSQPSPQE